MCTCSKCSPLKSIRKWHELGDLHRLFFCQIIYQYKQTQKGMPKCPFHGSFAFPLFICAILKTHVMWSSGPKSSFQMRASFVFHLETKVLESGGRVEKIIAQVAWSPVWSFHSLWWFGVQYHLLVLVHCVFWKPTSLHPFTKKCWSTSCFMLPSTDQLFKDADFIFQQDLAPAHTAKSTESWLNDHVFCAWLASKLTRPEHRESMRYCQEENEKQEATVKETWASYHLSSATNWSPPRHAELRQ